MSTRLLVSVGLGIILRAVINIVCSNNDKLAGLLSGVWDGIVAHAAWRSDWLLEPLVLIEIIGGVCFDALFHGSLARLIALALGCGLGVLFSDVAALHTLWDELEDNVQSKLRKVEIKNDLDEPDVLSEFSDDVTYIYEEYTVTHRGRKMSTADWIAAQRKARSSKSTSRRASAFIDTSAELDKSLLLSGLDTQTQLTNQTQSTRARRDKEILASMTPLATRSVAKTSVININIETPSSASRMSSPTVKSEVKVDSPSAPSVRSAYQEVVEETQIRTSRTSRVTSVSTSSNYTVQRKSPSVKPKTGNSPIDRPSFIPFSPDRTGTSDALGLHHHASPEPSVHPIRTPRESHIGLSEVNRSTTDHGSYTPFIPPRPIDSEMTTGPSSSKSQAHTLSQQSPVQPAYNVKNSIADFPSFVPFSTNNNLRSVMSRSRASSRRTGRFIEELTEDSFSRAETRQPTIRSKSSTRPASSPAEHEQAISANVLRSELSGHLPRERIPSPSPEVVIDYSGDTMRIHIPPPTQTGINVRIVPHADDNHHHQVRDDKPDLDHSESDEQDTRSVSAKPVPNRDLLDPPNSFFGSLDLDTVPPDEERSADEAHPIPAELSSDPQAPSTFNLERAWRNSRSVPSASPSINYAGRIADSDHPSAAIIPGNLEPAAEFHIARSLSNSASSQSPLLRRSRSAVSLRSYEDRNTLELDKEGDRHTENEEVAKTPIVEWFGPANAHNTLNTSHSSDKRLEMLSSDPVTQGHRQSPTFASSPSAKESILPHAPKVEIITRAQQLREQANDMEARCRLLRQERRKAQEQRRHALAFTLLCELEDAEKLTQKLHRKAERRFYSANNATQVTDKIDVHRLKVTEAVRLAERALYDVQQKGGTTLQVIVGHGKHSIGGVAILKNAIIDRMTTKHHLDVKIDSSNPGLIYISLPPTP